MTVKITVTRTLIVGVTISSIRFPVKLEIAGSKNMGRKFSGKLINAPIHNSKAKGIKYRKLSGLNLLNILIIL